MARWLAIVFGVLGLCSAIFCQDSKYDNYTLMRIIPHTKHHLEKLGRLQHDPEGVEILKRSRGVNRTTDVLVAPHMRWLVEEFVSKHKMPVEYKYHYGRDFESIPKSSVRRGFNPYGFNSYDDIRSEIYLLAKNSPDIVTIQDVGESYEERKMSLVKISTNPRGRNPVIFVNAGIHAREWVAPAMAMYLMRRLIKDAEAKKRELKGVDWYILPVVNPDGYEFSRAKKSNRLWRKTRSKHSSEDCYGVDGNRNFGFEWGGAGTSKDPCHPEIYCGPKAFSEPETQIVAKIMNEYKQRIKLYVSLHSYGSYLVYPWGFTAELVPEKWFRLHNLARMASDSVVRAGGKAFEVMSAGQWYPAAGGSDDYALGMVGIPYSYTMELTKGFEFTFPEELLKDVLPHYYAAFITFSVQIKKEFSLT